MKRYLSLMLAALLLCGLLSGCGASSKATYDMTAAQSAPAAMEEMAADNGAALRGSGETGSSALPENRKWVVTVYLHAETEDLDAVTEQLDEEIRALEGYVERQNVYNGSTYSDRRYRNADMTIRIPADKVTQFTANVGALANLAREETSREDITLTYVATQSRLEALETEQARLLELLAEAETMADLLEIEGRLTDVRGELEAVTTQMRIFDNQVDYATVHLYIEEVQEYTPVAEETVWQRITRGFSDSLEGLGEGTVDLMVWVLANSPYLVVWGILIILGLKLKKKYWKGRKKKEK